MKVFRILVCMVLLVSFSGCDAALDFLTGGETEQSKKYNFENCVDVNMKFMGPNADDGDRHSVEMMCQPCAMPGGLQACKKIVDGP